MLKVAFYPEVNGPVRGTPHVTEALHSDPAIARGAGATSSSASAAVSWVT